MKICVACSAGGHLIEALQASKIIQTKHDLFFITANRMQSKSLLRRRKAYFVDDTGRNIIKLIRNFFRVFSILKKEKPELIISTGAATALPTLYAGKFLGAKIIFIESLAAIDKPAVSGRFAYLIADLFIVQWKSLLKFYKKAVYGGQLI